jgi:O-antigen/teichoic acid export membrane protein
MFKSFNVRSEVIKNIIVLTSGTVLAQLVAYVLMPIITRLYTPDESAEFGLFIRIVGVGAAIATARYELALPVAKLDQHSFRIYRFALRTTLLVSMIALIALVIPMLLSKDPSEAMFYFSIPFSIALTAFMNLGTNWAVRMKRFGIISYSKLTNSIVGNVFKVIFGALQTGYIGLILGTLIGLVISVIFFFQDFKVSNRSYRIKSRSPRNYLLAKEYVEFPKVNLPHTMMDLGKDLLIALILWELYGQTEYGLFNHTYQMLRLPLVLIGTSIGQVFFQRCAEKINKGENVLGVAIASVRTLTLLSIVPFAVVFLFGEELFAFVFGEAWREAGVYAEIMTPWFMVNFITSPISSLPLILRKQRSFFFLAMFGTALMISTLFVPKLYFGATIHQSLYITSFSQAIYLVFVIFTIFGYAKNWKKE